MNITVQKSELELKLETLEEWAKDTNKIAPDVPIVRGMNQTRVNKLLVGYDLVDELILGAEALVKQDPSKAHYMSKLHDLGRKCYESISARFEEHKQKMRKAGILQEYSENPSDD